MGLLIAMIMVGAFMFVGYKYFEEVRNSEGKEND